ncbi:MAG TPA: 2OG-Fe(II) oxygenase family protein [Terriglobia bacterium]|nr:2OG-Fe(II) oxygenase family protein [Terriglobia bacterium]
MKARTSEVVRLFPTFVWKSQLDPATYKAINQTIQAHLPGWHGTGTAGAWQSGHGLHKLDALRALVAHIDGPVRSVLDFLKITASEYEITGCWANTLEPGTTHAIHSHPNNFLSGVYYVQIQPGADSISFHDPRPQTSIIRPPVTELTAYNTDQVVVSVAEGMLLLFPAWLPHSVSANCSDRQRISISFNVMFAEYEKRMSPPLWGYP